MGTLSRVLICIFVDMTRTSFLISVMLLSLLALQPAISEDRRLTGGSGGTSCNANATPNPAPVAMGCSGKCTGDRCEDREGRLAADLSDQCRCCFETVEGQQGQWGAPTGCSATPCVVATTIHHTTTRFNEQKSEDLLDLLQTESRADAKVKDFTCW